MELVKANKGIGGHQSANNITCQWLTPPEIIQAMGSFDLDPCSPANRPWDTAKNHYTEDGLNKKWFGRVWMNPPYGKPKIITPWMKKLSEHGNGITLIFARTETKMFFNYVWEMADSILFIRGRLHFYNIEGQRAKKNCGAPSVLIAYGEENMQALSDSGIKGKHLLVNSTPIVIVGISPSWKSVISIAITRLNGSANIQAIYNMVEQIAPDKVTNNKFYKEKIRQKLQFCFTKIQKGVYSNTTL